VKEKMVKAQNLDKLNELDKSLIAWMFANHVVGWTYCYMLEVKLDTPGKNILEGGGGLVTHGGNGSRSYAKHYGDDEWAVIHADDEDWMALDHEWLLDNAIAYLAGMDTI